jgi:hypothetical protein
VAFGIGMNNSPAHFGWETSDNLRTYPKTRKKAWKSSEEMAGAIPAKRPFDLQKLVSAT